MPPVPCETGGGHLSEVLISTLLTGTWAWQCSVNSTLPACVLEDSPAAAQPQNIPLAKNKLPLPAGPLPVRFLLAAPIQPHCLDPSILGSGLVHPGVFSVLEKCYQPNPDVNRKRPGWALGGKAMAPDSISAAALWTGQPSWHHLIAAHDSKGLGHFPSGAGNPCLSVLIIASRVQLRYRTFKDTLSHPNHGARLLLQLLLQKDTACCPDICIQFGQKKKPEICLQISQRLKRHHTSPSNHLRAGRSSGRDISSYPVAVMGLQRKSVVWHPDLLSHKSSPQINFSSVKSQYHHCKQRRNIVWLSQHQVFSDSNLRKHWGL